jgi:hypothetical protein
MSDDSVKNTVKGAIEAVYGPLEKILRTLAGPAAEEIGLSFKDSVQVWRFKRQIRLFTRVKEICDGACIDPQTVKLPLLFNIVDKATLEEDDEMQDIWANMLSNSADPHRKLLVTTAYPEILRQLCIEEVRFLNRIFETRVVVPERNVSHLPPQEAIDTLQFSNYFKGLSIILRLKNSVNEAIETIHLENLKRLGLIEIDEVKALFSDRHIINSMTTLSPGQCWLTALGYSFADACTTPPQKTIN